MKRVKSNLKAGKKGGTRRMRVVELRVASCELRVATNGKLTVSSASVCLFSQFKEIKRYILRLNKALSNDHILGPTAPDLKPFSDSKFKNFENRVYALGEEKLLSAKGGPT